MGDIDQLVLNLVFDAGKPGPLETPVREKHDLLSGSGDMRQHISKNPPGKQAGLDPAVRTGKKPVGFFQHSRGATLGALIVDKKVDGMLRLFFLGRGTAALRAESV